MSFVTPSPQFVTQLAVLQAQGSAIAQLIEQHTQKASAWVPGSLWDFSDDAQLVELKKLRDRARGLDPAAKVAVALNLLTEEGLPHFHRLITEHVGAHSELQRWCAVWTAEEDRHGNALRDYVRDAGLFRMEALDRLQFAFMVSGFHPDWAGSPYRLFAYTSLQERATQAAHANTARLAAAQEPLLQRVLAHLAGDELRHCAFYRGVFALILENDPDDALVELARVAPVLSMPGKTISGYLMMSEVERRAGIFGPREYAGIVRESLAFWSIDAARPGSGAGRAAQDALLALPERLLRLAERLEARSHKKSFRFEFLHMPFAA